MSLIFFEILNELNKIIFQDLGFIWSPVIEGDYSRNRFITEEPIHQVLEGRFQKMPIIIGQTKDEFGYFAFG